MEELIVLANASYVNIGSFNLAQNVTFKKLFSKVELSASARLVVHCLVAHWNPKKGLVFPKQTTIMEETGIKSDKSVCEAVKELKAKKLILTTKNGNKLNYYFSNIFFELVGVTGSGCKNYGDEGVKITGTCHEQKHEQKNNRNVLNFKEKTSCVSVETTRRYLEEQNNVKAGSPLDFNYEEAKEFLENLIPGLQNSYFARELRKKWNL